MSRRSRQRSNPRRSRAGRRPSRWTRPALAAGALVAVAVAAVLLLSDDDTEELRTGSVPTDDEPGLFEVSELPTSYRIDYRVEGLAGAEPVVTADRLWVDRPFASRLESYTGDRVEGTPSSLEVSTFGRLKAEGAGSEPVVVASPPGPGVSDVLVAHVLDHALEQGRIELRERREVYGRPCQVVRSGTQLAVSDLAEPGLQDYADTCFDEHGLVLEELLVVAGRPLLRRVATEVELDPDLRGVDFEVGEPTVPAGDGGGFVAEVVPGSRQPGRFFEPQRPDGFDRRGRYVVIPPQHENFTDPTRRGQRLTYMSDVFVDGPIAVVLDQGSTFGNVEPFPELTGVDLDIEGLGTAVLTYSQSGPVIVVPRPEGRFLRARGPVEPAVLVDLLESLEEVEGGELELVDLDG